MDANLEPSDAELLAVEESGLISFDDLFEEIKPALAPKKPPLTRLLEAEAATRSMYLDPAQWAVGRGIAVIHAATQTLLGAFREFTHKRVANCRKLVRADHPVCIEAVEEVSGSWWLAETHKPEPVQVWHERRQATIHARLPELNVHAPAVWLQIFLSYGAFARIELAQDTTFAQQIGPEEFFLRIPAGTNVLELLSRDCKIKLKEELGL